MTILLETMQETFKSIHTTLTPDSFWESINILVTKPHVINRRLWGNKTWFKYSLIPKLSAYELPSTIGRLHYLVTDDNIEKHKINIIKELNAEYELSGATSYAEGTIEVLLMELLPKNFSDNQAYQLVCLQKDKYSVTFYDVTPENKKQNLCPDFTYKIELNNSNIMLNAANGLYHTKYSTIYVVSAGGMLL